jgi:hypothetical protein
VCSISIGGHRRVKVCTAFLPLSPIPSHRPIWRRATKGGKKDKVEEILPSSGEEVLRRVLPLISRLNWFWNAETSWRGLNIEDHVWERALQLANTKLSNFFLLHGHMISIWNISNCSISHHRQFFQGKEFCYIKRILFNFFLFNRLFFFPESQRHSTLLFCCVLWYA